LAESRSQAKTIPLTLLQQPPSEHYRIAPGDVLAVEIDGILGDKALPLPVQPGQQVIRREERNLDAATGYPLKVQHDGTLLLPFLPPLPVAGQTLREIGNAIRDAYHKEKRLNKELDRVMVALLRPRVTKVLVFRQESANFSFGTTGLEAAGKRGTGHLVELQAGENDVLHALAQSGGLPGLDAYNQILIYRNCFHDDVSGAAL